MDPVFQAFDEYLARANEAPQLARTSMKRHDWQVAASIIAVATIFLALWKFGTGRLADFGLNGFTETLGIAFTVFLIDQLLRRREEARILPQRLAAFEDVRVLVQRRISFWFQAYMAAVPGDLPAHVRDLFSPQSIALVGGLLDMDSHPNVTPRRTWWQYVPEDLESLRVSAERILERYTAILDPKAFLSVHKLLTTTVEPGLPTGILQSDQEHRFPRPRVLGSYLPVLPDHFAALLALIEWLVLERQDLSERTGEALGEITVDLSGNRPQGTPPCMMAPEKLAAQVQALKDHHQLLAQESGNSK